MNKNKTIRDICFTAIFTAIIAVFSQISIPLPAGVPFTLQTFIIPLAGIILGAKKGSLAVVIYVILGAVGIPVFSQQTGGFACLFGKTGGFILSFPLMAMCAGMFSDIGTHKSLRLKSILTASGLILGTAINFICGMIMFSFITSSSMRDAFILCVLPFIPTAVIKIIIAGILGENVKRVLKKGRIL
jgi:biotin transport system substrate-specific component